MPQAGDQAGAGYARAILATSDPVFAALCQRALDGSVQLLAAVPPSALLETVRQSAPELIILDTDGEDAAVVKALATKVMLISDAHVVLVSAYMAPGSPALCAALSSAGCSMIDSYTFFPDRNVGPPPSGAEERWITTEDGQRLHAWFAGPALAAGAAPPPTLIWSHGNAGNIGGRTQILP